MTNLDQSIESLLERTAALVQQRLDDISVIPLP
jgi:hypothetical protein